MIPISHTKLALKRKIKYQNVDDIATASRKVEEKGRLAHRITKFIISITKFVSLIQVIFQVTFSNKVQIAY